MRARRRTTRQRLRDARIGDGEVSRVMLHELEHPCPPAIISKSGLNVRFWHKADIPARSTNVRFGVQDISGVRRARNHCEMGVTSMCRFPARQWGIALEAQQGTGLPAKKSRSLGAADECSNTRPPLEHQPKPEEWPMPQKLSYQKTGRQHPRYRHFVGSLGTWSVA